MYDIIIVGAGPAGLTGAIYALRANKKVLVLEAKSYGGQIINASCIDNYPGLPHISGIEYATKLYEQVKELGAEVKYEKVIEISNKESNKIVKTNKEEYLSKAVILATGSIPRKLNLENEQNYVGKGISYCATCDGMFFKDKNVAVVGGGDTALQDALYLSNICSKVYLIHRRDTFRGNELDLNKLKSKDNVEFILNSNVKKLLGNNLLDGIEVVDSLGNILNLNVEGLFVAIGQIPESYNLIKDLSINDNNYVIAKEDTKTNIDGIFVAGDIREKQLRQLTTAISDGAQAATSACEYIDNL